MMKGNEVLEAAAGAKAAGATRFCMGAAWREVKDGQAFDRVTNAQTKIGIDMARLPEDRARLVTQRQAADGRRSKSEDANLAESIAAMTQADAAHRAALGALATVGRQSLMDYLK
jgi:flagellin-like hook-associated protein FlgL